uniref:MTM0761 n=1 Tax=Volvox carteri f. nagariensis TaxID=3068 RepID=D9CJ78_VOLCA|nr:MTM0761 [Volvox carteri f. nagariensis]
MSFPKCTIFGHNSKMSRGWNHMALPLYKTVVGLLYGSHEGLPRATHLHYLLLITVEPISSALLAHSHPIAGMRNPGWCMAWYDGKRIAPKTQ